MMLGHRCLMRLDAHSLLLLLLLMMMIDSCCPFCWLRQRGRPCLVLMKGFPPCLGLLLSIGHHCSITRQVAHSLMVLLLLLLLMMMTDSCCPCCWPRQRGRPCLVVLMMKGLPPCLGLLLRLGHC
jgi:hypothetical protein